MQTKTKELVRVEGLKKHFKLSGGGLRKEPEQVVKAVDDLNFSVYEGETLGIVGESGCGKSTMGRLLLRLLEPTEGNIYFENRDITTFSKQELREKRREFQMIFQDPYASLNPRMTVKEIIEEPLRTYKEKQAERSKRVQTLLDAVGIPESYKNRYPHEFSGGQRQRIGIARSLALNPKFIVADEPVAALDVSIQAQVLNLMKDLQDEFGFTYLFIAHDLSVVNYISDRIGVMYLGKMVELADSDKLYNNPVHPYTQALLSAIPVPDPTRKKERVMLTGELPSPVNPPSGCRFHTRCPLAQDICKQVEPEWIEVEENHFAACHVVKERLS
ncbi:ABC transporter ATP-binding protein [Aquibacillus salsiterrae]|uniref:Dipeptide ABC transporter ATP-binding protein n=1 Tax=Aquibacillus salsiterrae TaxID=2950439 RepID=A0A9X4ADT1_9BACI|nr:dipeptide ABC transporter ATP-binding protein [Aquibacillus salsiterrae]MDC3415826.1 dipeptide ABC transporter ATP-binding protein [Aquibacillus salsiterrae]